MHFACKKNHAKIVKLLLRDSRLNFIVSLGVRWGYCTSAHANGANLNDCGACPCSLLATVLLRLTSPRHLLIKLLLKFCELTPLSGSLEPATRRSAVPSRPNITR